MLKKTRKPLCLMLAILFCLPALCSCDLDFIERSLYGSGVSLVETDSVVTVRPGDETNPDGTPDDSAYVLSPVRVIADRVSVYTLDSTDSEIKKVYKKNDQLEAIVTPSSMWRVYVSGLPIGYCESEKLVLKDSVYYAELPIIYGSFTNGYEKTYDAYSHLVDVRKYTDDIQIEMILATNNTSKGEPFYNRDLCLLQYDVLMMLLEAEKKFLADGYTIKIYDAYRPTSVQWEWYNIVKVHKWVACPTTGNGSMHDRGCAVDMSLINLKTGEELEMPTPMHTFSDAAARDSKLMSAAAKKNMNYMLSVMTAVGFGYINSEWWHFQAKDYNKYLPVDFDLDKVPLVLFE